jgi:predicted enzyme related to lactoylglutathione lyase
VAPRPCYRSERRRTRVWTTPNAGWSRRSTLGVFCAADRPGGPRRSSTSRRTHTRQPYPLQALPHPLGVDPLQPPQPRRRLRVGGRPFPLRRTVNPWLLIGHRRVVFWVPRTLPDWRNKVDMRLELVTVPVSDIDRAKRFYVDQVGFAVEQDVRVDEAHRFVELLPPGASCSVALTAGYVHSAPGSLEGVQLNVNDVDEVHANLRSRGVEVSTIQDYPWGRFCFFSDPDNNGWSIHGPLPD